MKKLIAHSIEFFIKNNHSTGLLRPYVAYFQYFRISFSLCIPKEFSGQLLKIPKYTCTQTFYKHPKLNLVYTCTLLMIILQMYNY